MDLKLVKLAFFLIARADDQLDIRFFRGRKMASPDHTASESLLASIIVARFLRSNNYNETLNTFIREAGLPSDAGAINNVEQWTLEGIIQEKKKFDQSLSFERHGDSQVKKDEWSMPGE